MAGLSPESGNPRNRSEFAISDGFILHSIFSPVLVAASACYCGMTVTPCFPSTQKWQCFQVWEFCCGKGFQSQPYSFYCDCINQERRKAGEDASWERETRWWWGILCQDFDGLCFTSFEKVQRPMLTFNPGRGDHDALHLPSLFTSSRSILLMSFRPHPSTSLPSPHLHLHPRLPLMNHHHEIPSLSPPLQRGRKAHAYSAMETLSLLHARRQDRQRPLQGP